MNRAAVLIGVERTGGLPRLKAAREGAITMADWAKANGFEAHLLTDADGPVTVAAIKEKVRELVDRGNLEQLLIYFGGHGVNLRFSEYWLLSGAPLDADEAVNVATSEAFARRSGIPHVVLVSDACRTAADGIQAQSVDGSSIFPNLEPSGPEKAVDLFFATVLGSPALEIRDPAESSQRYQAVYTEEVRAAVSGHYPECLVDDPQTGEKVLRPRRMKKLLEARVPLRVAALLGLAGTHTQIPDARITSDDEAWLARFPAPAPSPPAPMAPMDPMAPPDEAPPAGAAAAEESAADMAEAMDDAMPAAMDDAMPAARDEAPLDDLPAPRMEPPVVAAPPPAVEPSLPRATREALREATTGDAVKAVQALRRAGAGVRAVADSVLRHAQAFGPGHFETNCGFTVRGAAVKVAVGYGVETELLEPSLVRVEPKQERVGNVLLRFTDGRGVLLPAIRDFVATLSFEDGELRGVAYEPSDRSSRWADYGGLKIEMSTLRSLIASSARVGGFRLDRDDAALLTERIRAGKSLDPSMALYAAYSYHNLGRRDLIQQMNSYFAGDYGFLFFDLALLAGEKHSLQPPFRANRAIFPIVPLLAQGWALLEGQNGGPGALLSSLKRHVGPSLWTVFDAEGAEILSTALKP